MSDADERRILAAVDNSLAGNPVLVTARALARAFGVRVEALHVSETDERPDAAAAAVGVPLRVVTGPVVARLGEAAADPATAALVIGARSRPTSSHTLGSTALAVLMSCDRPVVVVPPVGHTPPHIRRVLVPLEGSVSMSLAPKALVELGRNRGIEVVALHVDEDGSVAEDEELLRRFCPWGLGFVVLEQRSGRREELVPAVADDLDCDLIALGWAQQLPPGRAGVVRAALERSPLPVMLIPARVEGAREPLAVTAGGAGR